MKKLFFVLGLAAVAVGLGTDAWALESATEPTLLSGTAVVAQDYSVGYIWKQDADQTIFGPYVGLTFKQKLWRGFTADLNARMFKAASNDALTELDMERAEASYIGPWFTISGGRRDLGLYLSPAVYFGSYITMGERNLDVASVTIPFRLFADVPDSDAEASAPFNAFSVIYIPTLYSPTYTDYSGKQGLVLGQLRVMFGAGSTISDFMASYGYGLADDWLNGSVSSAGALDLSYRFGYGVGHWYVEYGIQNFHHTQGTSVLCAGQDLNLKKFFGGIIEKVTVEGQLPLGSDPQNPFTGGNANDPSLGSTPTWCWFVKVENRLNTSEALTFARRLFYGGALTNSPGDYTFARIADGSLQTPVPKPYGRGPLVEYMPLRSPDYNTFSGLLYAGYEF